MGEPAGQENRTQIRVYVHCGTCGGGGEHETGQVQMLFFEKCSRLCIGMNVRFYIACTLHILEAV